MQTINQWKCCVYCIFWAAWTLWFSAWRQIDWWK